jgi:hypothetical protein
MPANRLDNLIVGARALRQERAGVSVIDSQQLTLEPRLGSSAICLRGDGVRGLLAERARKRELPHIVQERSQMRAVDPRLRSRRRLGRHRRHLQRGQVHLPAGGTTGTRHSLQEPVRLGLEREPAQMAAPDNGQSLANRSRSYRPHEPGPSSRTPAGSPRTPHPAPRPPGARRSTTKDHPRNEPDARPVPASTGNGVSCSTPHRRRSSIARLTPLLAPSR